jgi:hypothetical protein
MTRKTCSGGALAAAAALLTLAAADPAPVAPPAIEFRPSTDYCAEVDGAYTPDARFFATAAVGKFLIDLPSLSKTLLVDPKTRKAVQVPESSLKRERDDGIVRLIEPVPQDASAYDLSIDGSVTRVRIDDSDVVVRNGSSCLPVLTQAITVGPITEDSSARRCVQQEARATGAASGCAKNAYLKNSCNAAVVVVVLITQHLHSGTLPDTPTVVLPPGAEHSLGCVWPSGAMAPSTYDLRAVAFLEKKSPSGSRQH